MERKATTTPQSMLINQNIDTIDEEEKPWIHVNTKEDLTEEEKVELTNLLRSFGNSENITDMKNSINDLNRFVSVNRKYIGKYVKTKLLKLSSEQRMMIEINNLEICRKSTIFAASKG